jgi:alpha-beta hydrolase superfamily lysophospholipase
MVQLAFSIAALKQAFDVFSWEKPAPNIFVLTQYCEFYQLKFADSVQHFTGYISAAVYQIAVQAWVPAVPSGTLFIVHGYFDHVGLYRHLIAWALQHNLTVIAFDLPGHGLSSGEPASIDDFYEYQTVLESVLSLADSGRALASAPSPWLAVGQSTGAAILLDHLLVASRAASLAPAIKGTEADAPDNREQDRAQWQPPWQQVALLAPLVRVTGWSGVTISWQLLHRFQDRVPRGFAINSHDEAFLNFQKNEDPMQARYVAAKWVGSMIRWSRRIELATPCAYSPVILQGDEDTTVDYAFNLPLLSEKFAKPKIIMLPNGRHHLVNESYKLRTEMLGELSSTLLTTRLIEE